jgi:uncharacterized membrane protein
LLHFGAANGFLMATIFGLVRLLLSDYRSLRSQVGLARYEESEIIQTLGIADFAAQQANRNIGHDQWRLAFVASPRNVNQI